MPISKKPPMLVLEIGQKHFIYECILKSGEFVVNIPSSAMAEEVVGCGSCSGREVDKFERFGLTAEDSSVVRVPRLKEAIAVLECVLVEDKHLMEEYNMVPAEVKYAEVEEKAFDEHWLFRDESLRTVHHLGDRTFCFPENSVIDLRREKAA